MESNDKQMESEEQEEKKQVSEDSPPRKWGPQILGAMIGAFIAYIAGGLASQLGWVAGSTQRWWLWGGAIGGLFGSVDSLSNSGKILTKKDNRWLNIAVSLIGMAVIAVMFIGLSRLVGWIMSFFNL